MTISERLKPLVQFSNNFGISVTDCADQIRKVVADHVGFSSRGRGITRLDGMSPTGKRLQVICRTLSGGRYTFRPIPRGETVDVYVLCGFDGEEFEFFVVPGHKFTGRLSISPNQKQGSAAYNRYVKWRANPDLLTPAVHAAARQNDRTCLEAA